jgi:ketosteroid isomerase-like protein
VSRAAAAPEEIVLLAIKALTDARYPDYLDHLAEDVRFYTIGSTPYSGLVIGRQAVWDEVLSKTTPSIGEGGYREEIKNVICEGDLVVVESRGFETMANGAEYNNEYAAIYRVTGGKISELTFYLDTDLLVRSGK